MVSPLLRQRRRLAVFAVCVTLALGLIQVPSPLVTTGLALAIAAAVMVLLPSQRRWVEATGLGLVLAALPPLPPEFRIPLALACIALVHGLLYGPTPDWMGLRLGLDRSRQSRIARSVIETWTALIPGECHPEDHWTGTLADFDHDPDDPETLYLRYRLPGGELEEATLSFIAREPYRHCRYLFERSETGRPEEAIVTLNFIALTPAVCRIESRLQQEALPVGTALGRWFDDAFADELSSFASTMHNRPQRGIRDPRATPDTGGPGLLAEQRAAS